MSMSPTIFRYWFFIALFALLLAACTASVDQETEAPEQSEAGSVEASISNSPDDTEDHPAVQASASPTATPDSGTSEAFPAAETTPADDAAPDEPAGAQAEEGEHAAGEEALGNEAGEANSEEDAGVDGLSTIDGRTELLQQVTAEWNTDWERHTVPYDEIVPVLFRDAIRSLDEPAFVSPAEATAWLPAEDPVIVFELDGEARAYPLRILTAHEIVNDSFGEMAIIITYCPLCNSALVFDRRFGGQVLEFGTTGLLRNSDLIMYDRTSETLWQQFTGEGIVGEYAGERLTFLPSSIVSFEDFQSGFVDGMVLSNDTGFPFDYSLSSYQDYDQIGQEPYLFIDYDGEAQAKEIDQRLPAMERVVSVSLDSVDIAYPVSMLSEVGVINDSQAGQDLVVFHSFGTASAFYNTFAGRFDDVGATGVFNPNLEGQLLTFSKEGGEIVDDQTGSVWNILGQATVGPLAGKMLTPIMHGDHFWFSWAAFKPDTLIYEG